jgi:polyisoprenoid-binding protein YceI
MLSFDSTKFEKTGEHDYLLHGHITLRGVTKPIVLNASFRGMAVDLWGLTRAGFEITGSIMRADFGLHWNASTDDGSIVLADEVKLMITVQMIKQA